MAACILVLSLFLATGCYQLPAEAPTPTPVSPNRSTTNLLQDEVAGTAIWHTTDQPGLATHAHCDISPWSPDGFMALYSAHKCQDCEDDSDVYVAFVE